jgi:hypothetical protein
MGTTASAAPDQDDATLTVEITSVVKENDPLACGDEVEVTARICNVDFELDTATNVSATLTWDPDVFDYVSGPLPNMDDLDLTTVIGCIQERWVLEKTGVPADGDVEFMVEAYAENAAPVTDNEFVDMPALKVEFSKPDHVCAFCEYDVNVTVTNLDCVSDTVVMPTMVTDPACKGGAPCEPLCGAFDPVSYTLAPEEVKVFTSTCECLGPDPVEIVDLYVDAEKGGVPVDPAAILYDFDLPIEIVQEKAHLVGGDLQMPEQLVVGQDFTLLLPVDNTGTGAAEDVYFELLNVTGGVDCGSFESGKMDIPAGESRTLELACTCTAPGDVTFDYEVYGTDWCQNSAWGCLIDPSIPEDNKENWQGSGGFRQIMLEIHRLEPQDNEHFVKSQIFDVQANFVTDDPIVDLSNPTHEELVPDEFTYTGLVHAELVFAEPELFEVVQEPHPNPFYLWDNEEGKRGVWWKVHVVECPEPAPYTTTITIVGTTEEGGVVEHSFDVVLFPGHPQLKTEIVKPYIHQKYASQSYSVMAIITNTCGEVANDVEATLSWWSPDGGEIELWTGESWTKSLGNIKYRDSMVALWTVHAKTPGTIYLTVTPSGRDDVTGKDLDMVTPDTITIKQVPREDLTITLMHPPTPADMEKIGYLTEFTITAKIENTGFATLDFSDPAAIWPMLEFVPDDSLEVLDVDYGSLEGDPYLEKDEYTYVTWWVKCIRAEATESEEAAGLGTDQYLISEFTVRAAGVANTCDCLVEAEDSSRVMQKYLIVEIIYPDDGHWWRVGQEWNVIIAVTPYGSEFRGGTAIATVDGALVIDGSNVIDFADRDVPVIADGETVEFEGFHMRCTGPNPGTIHVRVTGVAPQNPIANTYTNEDEVTVYQSDAPPELTIDILDPVTSTWYQHGEEIVVTAEVMAAAGNRPPALDAMATLNVSGDCMAVDSLTKDLGAFDPGEVKTVQWTLVCVGACDCSFEAMVEWYDPTCATDEMEWTHMGPAYSNMVTVHQFPLKPVIYQHPNEVDTGSTFDIHAKIYNDGCECYDWECPECGVPEVWATIEILEGQAELATGEVADKYVGTVICPREYAQEAEWTLKCTGPGTVKVRVNVWTEHDAYPGPNWGQPLPGGKRLVSSSDIVIVDQIPSLDKYTIQLCKHWNYFSLPLIPMDDTNNIESEVLASVYGNVVEVWGYDAFNKEWMAHFPGWDAADYANAGLMELEDMVDGKGYLVSMNYPDILEGEGYEFPPEFATPPLEYGLAKGWNLIGFKTMDFNDDHLLDGQTAGWYLKNLLKCAGCETIVGGEARFLRTYICGYPGTNRPGGWEVLTSDDDMLMVGQAYWLYASSDDLSIVPPIAPQP